MSIDIEEFREMKGNAFGTSNKINYRKYSNALKKALEQQQAENKELREAQEWICSAYIATKKGTNEIDDTQCEFPKYKPNEELLNGWEWREFILVPKPPKEQKQ